MQSATNLLEVSRCSCLVLLFDTFIFSVTGNELLVSTFCLTCQVHAGEEDHAQLGWTTSRRRQAPHGRVSQNDRTEINGESTSMAVASRRIEDG